jgi:hypothetical protein
VCGIGRSGERRSGRVAPERRRQGEDRFGTLSHDLVHLAATAGVDAKGDSSRKTLRDSTFPRRKRRTAVAARPLRRTLVSEVREMSGHRQLYVSATFVAIV